MSSILVQDTAIRANTAGNATASNAAGWSTSSDSNTYSQVGGALTYSILNNQLKSVSASNVNTVVTLSANTYAIAEAMVRISMSASGNGFWGGLVLRYASSSSFYACYIKGSTSNLVIAKASGVGNPGTALANATFTLTANTEYWLKFRASGTSLMGKVWLASGSEPDNWMVTVTDGTIASGGVGLYMGQSLSGQSILFDTYTVNDTVTAYNSTSRSTYKIAVPLTSKARTIFLMSAAIKPIARDTFKIRPVIKPIARAAFKIRQRTSSISLARFLISHFVSRPIRANYGAQASVLNFLNKVLYPLSSVYASSQLLIAAFSTEFPMATPNTTILSTITVTDNTGATVSNLSVCNVVVNFPDASTSSLSLGSGVTNVGSGVYQARYSTKGTGEITEVWSLTAADGTTTAQIRQYVAVAY